jgi:pimeloyl-ACP methyl ester carboxylesterase
MLMLLLAAVLKLAPCTPAGPAHPMECGKLAVPENREQPGRTIELSVVVVPATGPRTLPPLYYLDGGPGIAASGSADFWSTAGASHLRHRDVVLVDQRGTGRSAPLRCPEDVQIGNPLLPTLDVAAVARCRDQLAAHADLSRYSTADAVADLDDVRAALGHERVDLLGLSYGTRVEQEYLRAHAMRVRAAAMLGSLPPGEKLPLPFARTAQRVLEVLERERPGMAEDVATLAKKEAGQFWEAMRPLLTTTDSQRRLPSLLHQAAQGDLQPILKAMNRHPLGSDGLLLSVSCPEDTLHITEADIAAQPKTVFGRYRVDQQIAACRAWKVAPRKVERSFVQVGTPVLLLAGSMDQITPPEWAEQIAAHLPASRVVRIPLLSHFPDGLSHMECYDAILVQFYEAGGASGLDLASIGTMQPPPFAP